MQRVSIDRMRRSQPARSHAVAAVALGLAVALVGGACGDDGHPGNTNGPDAGAPPDARPGSDAEVPPVPEGWPLGIPAPEFGVEETVASVHGDGGYFTHWVDNTGACDDGGPGTPAAPRCTIPRDLVAGDVVVVAAGTYTLASFWMDVTGTAAAPIFLRGPEAGPWPVIRYDASAGPGGLGFDLRAEYLIVEHLEFAEARFLVEPGSHHVALRHSAIHHHPDRTGVSLRGTDLVVWDVEVHHFQGVNRLGIGGACGAARIWVVGNHLHHNAEDSVQFGHGCEADPVRFVYLGGNVMHGDRENAADFKWVEDVVVSRNVMFGYRSAPTDQAFCYDDGSRCDPAGFHDSGSDGSALVVGSDGESRDVWLVGNEIYDSQRGIRVEETSTSWLVGNLLHGILGDAFVLEKRGTVHITQNTVVDAGLGLSQVQDAFTLRFANNLVAGVAGRFLDVSSSSLAGAATLEGNLFWNGPDPVTLRWVEAHSLTSAADFAALTAGTVQGNLLADPGLADPAQGDYRPGAGSPAEDAAAATVPAEACAAFLARHGLDICVDLDDQPRPRGAGWDVGAYER